MDATKAGPRLLRFGAFEADLRTGELRKQGLKVKLPGQPFQILAMLLERPGELVTREEIRERLWGGDTFLDFEHSVNNSINRLRGALGDDPAAPRFVETLPRHGYRFIAPVEVEPSSPAGDAGAPRPVTEGEAPPRPGRAVALAGASALALATLLLAFDVAGWRGCLLRRITPAPRIDSLAVLPLENLSHDPAQEYFADGMTEELITNLGKIGALRVISRTSVLRFKGTKQPLSQIARDLNVDALVEGTVLLSGNRVRITANLLHASTDRHLWAETYERDLQDVLSLQGEVAESVARAIKVALSPAESRRLATVRSVKPEAYGLYLKGRYHYYRWTPDDFRRAIEYFQKAIDADPDWAPAYAGLATSYGWLWIFGGVSAQEALPRFEAALKTALAIDDADPQARYALAASAFLYRWDWEEADREFRRALALDPGLVEARFEYAWFLSAMGRFPAAVAEAQRAVDRDPLSVSANFALGDIYFLAREDERAASQFSKTIEVDPNDPRPYEGLAGIYHRMGRHQVAVTTSLKAMTLSGARPDEVAAFARVYSQSGYEGCLRWRLEREKDPYWIALVHVQLGHKDEALAWLERAYRAHSWAMCQLKVLSTWDPVRSDPRFQDLLRLMKFPP